MIELTSEAGQRMLDNLPPYYAEDDSVRSYLQVVGAELDRAGQALELVRDGFFPQKASDVFNMLALWEALLRIPNDTTATVNARRSLLLSRIRSRRSGSAELWASAATTAIGSSGWSQRENYPGSYQVSVSIPYDSYSVAATTVANLLRDITPAHLQLIVGYQGFVVDSSKVDEGLV